MLVNLDHKRLDFLFVWSLLLTLIFPVLFPAARLHFFAPFLIVACYQRTLSYCLWLAFMCGVLLDLLSSYVHFGLHAFDFCLALAIVYTQRRNFFADSLTTLPLMTFFFSVVSTLIMALLLNNIEMQHIFSQKWLFTDLFIMPVIDSLYAFVCFVLPSLLFGKQRRKGKDYFLSR
jgi:rod shape-determining protein MreD